MSRIDMHIHSRISGDGELLPRRIAEECRRRGMELIAVTDHNSVRGVAEVMEAAEGLKVLSGVELDCSSNGRNFHLLGYDFDYTRLEFAALEQDILKQERAASEEKIRLFRSATGIPVSVVDVMAASENGVVSGELIGELLLNQKGAYAYELLRPYLPGGDKSDMPHVHFYWDFFAEGKVAYVPIHYISLPDAAALIHKAGGYAVIAHPGQNVVSEKELDEMVRAGIDGMEVFSSYHTCEEATHYLAMAEQRRLFITCGSDFHGKHKPAIYLGGHGAFQSDEVLLSGLGKIISAVL